MEENPVQTNSKDGRFTISQCIHQQKPQLTATLIEQSQLVVTQIGLKLTQRMNRPPNTNRKETNRDKGNVLQHHRQIVSQDRNLIIQKMRKRQPMHSKKFQIRRKRANGSFLMRKQPTPIDSSKSIYYI